MDKYNGKERGKGGEFKEETTGGTRRRIGNADSVGSVTGLADVVECVISSGAYLSFGRTSDGGATLIRVLDGDTKLSSYCTTTEELLDACDALLARYAVKPTAMPQSRPPVTFTAPDGRKKTVG